MPSGQTSWSRDQAVLLSARSGTVAIERDVNQPAMPGFDFAVATGGTGQEVRPRREPAWRLSLVGAVLVHACLLVLVLTAPSLSPHQSPSLPEVVPVSLSYAAAWEPETGSVEPAALPKPAARPVPAVRRSRTVASVAPVAPSRPPVVAEASKERHLPSPAAVSEQPERGVASAGGTNDGAAGQGAMEVPARPRYQENRPPAYPEQARRRRIEGTVVLEVLVNGGGSVNHLAVQASSGHRLLDEAALRAVRGWRFEPGRRGSVPVTTKVLVPVRFVLQ
jgi:periplasmic protein TonB